VSAGRHAAIGAAAIALALGSGCASQTREQNVVKDMEAVRRETTPDRLQSRGEAAAAVGDLTRAEQYFVAALKAGGDDRVLTRRLLVVCAGDGRYPAAAVYGEEYLRKHPGDTEVRFALSTVQLALGELQPAREGLERVVSERPDLADAHYALATILREEGEQLADADRHLREYIRLRPDGQYVEAARASLLKSVP
jgi:tetratricopeptide (TPR) repeat protein